MRTTDMKRNLLMMLALCWLGISFAHAQSPLPAFPGAEGFGAVASGGRGGQVLTVTTLAPSGEGSLQAALDTPGARTIVFAVSGVIDTTANITHGNVTIAGQTSPGGIIVRGLVCDGHYEGNDCSNIIVRHVRSRPAAHMGGGGWILDDALRLDGLQNAIIDHSSFAHASDEAVQISLAQNITIQHSILAETVGDHAHLGGMLINYSHSRFPQDNLSIHHNLWYRLGGRLPEITCDVTAPVEAFGEQVEELPSECASHPLHLELSNNLLFDMGSPITYGDNLDETRGMPPAGLFVLHLNWAHNYAIVRPDYPYGMFTQIVTAQPNNQVYMTDNRLNLYPDYSDQQLVYCCNDFALYHPNTEPAQATLLAERHAFPPITYHPTDQLVVYTLQQAGAFPRDPMDQRIIDAVAQPQFSTLGYDQPIANDAFALGFDPNQPPAPPVDTDGDGMPDEWESQHGLDPLVQDHNGNQLSSEGYTNLEVYLNELADALVRR